MTIDYIASPWLRCSCWKIATKRLCGLMTLSPSKDLLKRKSKAGSRRAKIAGHWLFCHKIPPVGHIRMSGNMRSGPIVTERDVVSLNGFAIMSGNSPFDKISKQPPPTDPRIKHLLGKALSEPDKLSPEEVREMAASVVYHLLAAKEAITKR